MLKSCKYCGRIHDSKYICPMKPVRTKQNNEKDKFRWSRKWQKKREEIKRRDLYLCKVCQSEDVYTYNGLEVHHIEPLAARFDLRLEDNNLITLCEYHHEMSESNKITKEHLVSLIQSPRSMG